MIPINSHILSYFCASLILLTGCKNPKASQPAKLQIISMVPSVKATVTITPINSSNKKASYSLAYASPSGYHSFTPGRYNITYAVEGKIIIDHIFALGKKSYQSLLIAGMMSDSLQRNPQTTLFTIRKILAGNENDDANGYMPQYVMLRDQFQGSKKKGLIRLINLSPFVRPVSIQRSKKKVLKADYLHKTDPLETNPNMHHFQFFMDNILLAKKALPIKKGYLHTIITGNGFSPHSLTSISYETPTKAILK